MADPAATTPVSPGRALLAGVVAVAVVEAGVLVVGPGLSRAVPAMLLLLSVVLSGVLGGRMVALGVGLVAAVAFAVLLPPIGSPRVEVADDIVALGLFVVVAVIAAVLVSSLVLSDRRRLAAEHRTVEALRQVDRDRSALLRSVSHDLRTPLATIRAAATELVDFPHEEASRRTLLELVAEESERLDRIVGNLLSLTRVEAGALLPDRHPVDVGELVRACVDRLARATGKVEVEVSIEPGLPLASLDYSQFDQVVANLVENAARHSPPGGVVRVALDRRPGGVRLSVLDRGDGIAPEVRDRLFEPFASATGSGSSGIGLAICRAIVEAHGGTIVAEDPPGGGACLVVELPDG